MLDYIFSKRLAPPYFLCIHFKPELEWLSAYLFQISDRRCYEWIKEGINDVVCKKVEYIERDMEWYGAKIQSETTLIYPTIGEDNQEAQVISTSDFADVISAWIEEKEKYDVWKTTIE